MTTVNQFSSGSFNKNYFFTENLSCATNVFFMHSTVLTSQTSTNKSTSELLTCIYTKVVKVLFMQNFFQVERIQNPCLYLEYEYQKKQKKQTGYTSERMWFGITRDPKEIAQTGFTRQDYQGTKHGLFCFPRKGLV